MMPSWRRRCSGGEEWRDLVHDLNQRYHQEWERAERLQAELNDIQRSRAWPVFCWLRRVRRWLSRPAASRPAASRPTQESVEILDDLPETVAGSVSIVIPFKDRVGLLRNCLRSLRNSTYKNYEIVLVDNGSVLESTRQFLAGVRGRRRLKVIDCPGSFHFSRLCNLGARQVRGRFLLFLNNDTEIMTPDWLQQLLRLGCHRRVGVAGATLCYPDGHIQHAGIFPLADGRWFHAYRGFPGDYPGERGELRQLRAVPAVTGACLLMRRDLFQQLGGFAEQYPVTGNDVDLCLRVRQQGLLVAITPHARLRHYESLSRGYAPDPGRTT